MGHAIFNVSQWATGVPTTHQLQSKDNRAVSMRENKPRITQSAAYVSLELLV